jgi:hypothetical protein
MYSFFLRGLIFSVGGDCQARENALRKVACGKFTA